MGLLYTQMKIFHYQEKLASLGRDVAEILPPVHIRIKPTNVCNHKCNYCAYRADGLQLGKDMDLRDYIPSEKMEEIIDDIIKMGVKAVTFSGGGEPFCYPYLLKTVKQLADSPVKFASLTNGAMVHGEVAEVFAHHATWLRVSMDGWSDESYSMYRGVPPGEFSKVVDNMKRFKEFNGPCYLGVSFIVDQQNASHLHGFIGMMRDIGVNSVKVSPCIVSNDGRKNNEYHKPIFSMVKTETAKAISDFGGDGFEIFDSYHELDNKFDKNYDWCPYLQILPVIGADSRIYSCQDKAYNLEEGNLGSIKNQHFMDFWQNDKEKFFQIHPSKHCNHHCVANSKNKLVLDYLHANKDHLGFV